MQHNQIFIAFVNCTIKGDWIPVPATPGTGVLLKIALNDKNCTVNIFQIDTVRKYLFFKKGSKISIMNNNLIYDSPDADELTINEYITKYQIINS